MVSQSEKAFVMEIGEGDNFAEMYTVDVQDYQNLKETEDRATDVLLCLDSTLDTVSTIKDMYRRAVFEPDAPSEEHMEDEILFALKEKERDIAYSRQKVLSLLSKAQNTRALVGLASTLFTYPTSNSLGFIAS